MGIYYEHLDELYTTAPAGVIEVYPECAPGEDLTVTWWNIAKWYLTLPPGTYFYICLEDGRDEVRGKDMGRRLAPSTQDR